MNARILAIFLVACDAAPPEKAPNDDAGEGADDPGGMEPAAATCDADHLRALELPVDPDDPYSETFTYYYQWIDNDGDGPTVIHVPGGPGVPSIGTALGLPEGVDVVLTDPRGVGCNAAEAPREASFYSTDRFASDVLAIVRDLELEDYVVYGHSYGTVLGTVVASRAEDEGLPAPRLVVLEGVLGPAVETDDAAYRTLWPIVRDALPPDVRDELLADPPPLGRSRGVWGETITGVLSQYSPDVLFALLMTLADGGDTQELESLLDAIGGGTPLWEDPVMMGLFRPVACNEVAEHSWFGFELRDGEVRPTVDACDEIDLSRPYDPADWPIAAPIVYVQGDADPATPITGARAHFDAHADTTRTFVTVHGVGHVPLQWRIAEACGASVWKAILADDALAPVLEACGVDATVEYD
jgi:pimeloyl-ACP methyl ester carboxylesterase